jgi:hypothetical protein
MSMGWDNGEGAAELFSEISETGRREKQGLFLLKNLELAKELLKIQGKSGNWNCDPYMHGMYNGMELTLATIQGFPPEFRSAPQEYIKDIVKQAKIEGVILCIEKLRELQNQYKHESKWNHSNNTHFAPVELSDYLLREVLRKLQEKGEN